MLHDFGLSIIVFNNYTSGFNKTINQQYFKNFYDLIKFILSIKY